MSRPIIRDHVGHIHGTNADKSKQVQSSQLMRSDGCQQVARVTQSRIHVGRDRERERERQPTPTPCRKKEREREREPTAPAKEKRERERERATFAARCFAHGC